MKITAGRSILWPSFMRGRVASKMPNLLYRRAVRNIGGCSRLDFEGVATRKKISAAYSSRGEDLTKQSRF